MLLRVMRRLNVADFFRLLPESVTMQNLFHDGGYSFTGIGSEEMMDQFR